MNRQSGVTFMTLLSAPISTPSGGSLGRKASTRGKNMPRSVEGTGCLEPELIIAAIPDMIAGLEQLRRPLATWQDAVQGHVEQVAEDGDRHQRQRHEDEEGDGHRQPPDLDPEDLQRIELPEGLADALDAGIVGGAGRWQGIGALDRKS